MLLNFENDTQPNPPPDFEPRTGTAPAAGQPTVVVATGDGAAGRPPERDVTDLIEDLDPNLFLYLGDVYERGSRTEYFNYYGMGDRYFGRFRSITNPVIGNHEYHLRENGYMWYWGDPPLYYSYDVDRWHMVALDSVGDIDEGSTQYEWLKEDLTDSDSACSLVYLHHNVFGLGDWGNDPRLVELWELLVDSGVDLVLAGHEHNYQRWKPIDASRDADSDGVVHIVAGAGGHGVIPFDRDDDRLAHGEDENPDAFGALRLELFDRRVAYEYVNIDEDVLDSGSIECSGPIDSQAPSEPTDLRTRTSFPTHADLVWDATNDADVDHHEIHRNGTKIAEVEGTNRFSDGSVTPGQTYEYRIRSVDTSGNTSGLSEPLSVQVPDPFFADDFESGDLSHWNSSAAAQPTPEGALSGTYALRLSSQNDPAFVRASVGSHRSMYWSAYVKAAGRGRERARLMTFKANKPVVSVGWSGRGKLTLRNHAANKPRKSRMKVTGNRWHRMEVFVSLATGRVRLWWNGDLVGRLSKKMRLKKSPFELLQLGESVRGAGSDILFDDVMLDNRRP